MRNLWFRPVIPCDDAWTLWTLVWNWIGSAYAGGVYPEEDRKQRYLLSQRF